MTTDATIYQGEHVLLHVTVWNDASKTVRKNLAGCTAEYRVGHKNKDELVFRITNIPNAHGSALTIADPTNGLIDITIREGDTDIQARRYTHQVIVIDSAGKMNVVTDGFLTIGETLPNV